MPTETSPPKRGRKPKQPAPVEPVQTTEQIVRIPLTELHPFPDHPYGIREDQAMQDTADSVKQNGVVVPAIVRPRAEGGYEIVAGHRRKLASEQAGFTDMPCIVRNLTDDEAIIQLVDSNAQRRMYCRVNGPKPTRCVWRPSSERREGRAKTFQKMRRIIRRISAATMKWEMSMGSAAIPSATSFPSLTWSRS